MIDIDAYEKMTWETPSDELEDAVENLLAEVKRLRSVMIHVEQRQPHPALELSLIHI